MFCYQCGAVVNNWKDDDDALQRHKLYNKDCLFLQKRLLTICNGKVDPLPHSSEPETFEWISGQGIKRKTQKASDVNHCDGNERNTSEIQQQDVNSRYVNPPHFVNSRYVTPHFVIHITFVNIIIVCLCVCICLSVCMCLCVCVYVYINVCVFVCLCGGGWSGGVAGGRWQVAGVCVSSCMCVYVRVHVCVSACMHVLDAPFE